MESERAIAHAQELTRQEAALAERAFHDHVASDNDDDDSHSRGASPARSDTSNISISDTLNANGKRPAHSSTTRTPRSDTTQNHETETDAAVFDDGDDGDDGTVDGSRRTRRGPLRRAAIDALKGWRIRVFRRTYIDMSYGPDGLLPDTVVTSFVSNPRWTTLDDISDSPAKRWWALTDHGHDILRILKRVDDEYDAEIEEKKQEKKRTVEDERARRNAEKEARKEAAAEVRREERDRERARKQAEADKKKEEERVKKSNVAMEKALQKKLARGWKEVVKGAIKDGKDTGWPRRRRKDVALAKKLAKDAVAAFKQRERRRAKRVSLAKDAVKAYKKRVRLRASLQTSSPDASRIATAVIAFLPRWREEATRRRRSMRWHHSHAHAPAFLATSPAPTYPNVVQHDVQRDIQHRVGQVRYHFSSCFALSRVHAI